jgi:ABC-type enterochelin transport system substrate-binding protein
MKIGAAMHDFMQKQIEASERLYNMMMADHKQRFEKIAEVYALSESLQKKINERDEEIQKLKRQLFNYESLERM